MSRDFYKGVVEQLIQSGLKPYLGGVFPSYELQEANRALESQIREARSRKTDDGCEKFDEIYGEFDGDGLDL